MLLFEPLEDGLRTVEIVNDRVVTSLVKNPGFDLVVVDEAHHLYRDDKLRALVERQIGASARRLILSDLSQSDGRLISYPSPMQEVLLTEVVRSSKRVVAGAMQFQLGGEAKLYTQCHHESTGPPLRTFLFDAGEDRIGKYASETVRAIDAIVSDFSGLSLHDRVAIILPNEEFGAKLKPQLETQLGIRYDGRFEFVKASEAAVVVGGRTKGTEWLLFDTAEQYDGLERLIVIAVGLDAIIGEVTSGAGDSVEARSHLYRAITRAHMTVLVVNELLSGGWLEYLSLVKLEDKPFEAHREVKMNDATATDDLTDEQLTLAALSAASEAASRVNEKADVGKMMQTTVQLRRACEAAETAGMQADTPEVAIVQLERQRVEPMAKSAVQAVLETIIGCDNDNADDGISELKRDLAQAQTGIDGALLFGLLDEEQVSKMNAEQLVRKTRVAVQACGAQLGTLDRETPVAELRSAVLKAKSVAEEAYEISHSRALDSETASLAKELDRVEHIAVAVARRRLDTILTKTVVDENSSLLRELEASRA